MAYGSQGRRQKSRFDNKSNEPEFIEQTININTASASQLESLPGIGPSLAERIVAYREANGPFRTPSDILEVSGIGDATFANIEDRIVTE